MKTSGTLVEIRDNDRRFFAERIDPWLPGRIVDIHTHIWRSCDYAPGVPKRRETLTAAWPARVARDNSIEDLMETYRLMLPGRDVIPLVFPNIPQDDNLDRVNAYASESSRKAAVPALVFSDPAWSAVELEKKIVSGGFIGIKSYLSMAAHHISPKDIRVSDYFPEHHLELIDRLGMIVMLHLPGDRRLGDPANLEHLLHIDRKYPKLKLVVAHIGRAYCDDDAGNAFEVLASSRNLCFDFSANTNDRVLEKALKCVGPRRVIFGTDLPIERMRMRRIIRDGRYVNLVPKGMYGDVSDDRNMGEVEGQEALDITFFLYEQLDAFRLASERLRLKTKDIEDIFFNNGKSLVEGAGWKF